MNLGKLFDWHYLTAPYALTGLSWPMRIILVIFFAAAVIAAIYAGKQIKAGLGFRKLWLKIQTWGFSIGIIGFLLIFFREVKAVYLGSRLWLLLLLLVAIIWLGFIIRYWKIQVPLQAKLRQEKTEFEKWLPKKKA